LVALAEVEFPTGCWIRARRPTYDPLLDFFQYLTVTSSLKPSRRPEKSHGCRFDRHAILRATLLRRDNTAVFLLTQQKNSLLELALNFF
jgi:hypothetical protein